MSRGGYEDDLSVGCVVFVLLFNVALWIGGIALVIHFARKF